MLSNDPDEKERRTAGVGIVSNGDVLVCAMCDVALLNILDGDNNSLMFLSVEGGVDE